MPDRVDHSGTADCAEVAVLLAGARRAVEGGLNLPPARAARAAAVLARCALEAFVGAEVDRLAESRGLDAGASGAQPGRS